MKQVVNRTPGWFRAEVPAAVDGVNHSRAAAGSREEGLRLLAKLDAEACEGVEFGQRDRRELLEQLVETDVLVPGQLAQAVVLLVGQSKREGAHGARGDEDIGVDHEVSITTSRIR